MIVTDLALLAYADQVLAALAHVGPCTSEALLAAAGVVHCPCPRCCGRARLAVPNDLSPVLRRLARHGLVVGILEPVDGEDTWDVMWRRVAPPAAMDFPES